jgi:hypothetical protein
MQLLVIQFKTKMFNIGFMQVGLIKFVRPSKRRQNTLASKSTEITDKTGTPKLA